MLCSNHNLAFAVQSRFQDRVIEVTDAFQKMDHFYWYRRLTILVNTFSDPS